MAFERMRIFTGNANPKLAAAVCKHLNVSLGRCQVGMSEVYGMAGNNAALILKN